MALKVFYAILSKSMLSATNEPSDEVFCTFRDICHLSRKLKPLLKDQNKRKQFITKKKRGKFILPFKNHYVKRTMLTLQFSNTCSKISRKNTSPQEVFLQRRQTTDIFYLFLFLLLITFSYTPEFYSYLYVEEHLRTFCICQPMHPPQEGHAEGVMSRRQALLHRVTQQPCSQSS